MQEKSIEYYKFSTTLPVVILIREPGSTDWQNWDSGPGYFTLQSDREYGIRVRQIDDENLAKLVDDLKTARPVVFLNLSENRGITDAGISLLVELRWLTMLNLGACDLTNSGLEPLKLLSHLSWLDLSYCNRLTDLTVKPLSALRNLTFLNLQGCVKITNHLTARLRRPGLEIRRGQK